jgi:hypothetical protein
MILRLCWGVVNPKRQMKPSMAAHSEIPMPFFAPDDFLQIMQHGNPPWEEVCIKGYTRELG